VTITYVLMQNLNRNPLRTMLTAAAFALPMAVFVAAISLVVLLAKVAAANEKELRLGVRQKTSLINLLPEGMRRKIEALDPDRKSLRAVCGMRWFGGRVPDTQNTLTSLAADADTFPLVYSDVQMTTEESARWMADRTACVAGLGLAEQYHWKVGDRVTLESTVPPYLTLEFHLVKIMTQTERGNVFYLRRDYLEESLRTAGFDNPRCNIFWVKCASADGLRDLQTRIDKEFANSPEETKSEDENAFAANFTQAGGDIPGLMQAMAIVVVCIIALVAGNTMMMSFRERIRELAVFKAIGFQSGRIFTIVLAESAILALIGSLAGVLPTAAILTLVPMRGLRMGPISRVEISPVAVIVSIVIALIVGLAAGLWPAYQAMRLRSVDALRRIA
jgi:putative ABC transport system permease protein